MFNTNKKIDAWIDIFFLTFVTVSTIFVKNLMKKKSARSKLLILSIYQQTFSCYFHNTIFCHCRDPVCSIRYYTDIWILNLQLLVGHTSGSYRGYPPVLNTPPCGNPRYSGQFQSETFKCTHCAGWLIYII
jgi:hypothetical protein